MQVSWHVLQRLVPACLLSLNCLGKCRDIEAGLGEEWAAKGTRGTAERPHWGHNFWRGSHAQDETAPGQLSPVQPVAAVAPVAGVQPVGREGVNGHVGNGAMNSSPSTGWV